MKSKDKKELHLKGIKELQKQVSDLKDKLVGLVLDKTQNKLKNTSQIPIIKKEVAQILTVIRIKELAEKTKAKKV